MRRVFLTLTALATATVSGAQPQPPGELSPPRPLPAVKTPAETKKLQADREALKREIVTPDDPADDSAVAKSDRDRAALRAELTRLIRRLGEERKVERQPAPVAPIPETPTTRPKYEPPNQNTHPADVIRSGQNLFRSNAIKTALDAFRTVNESDNRLEREDRAFLQYMIACCHRRLGDYPNALAKYREVADTKEDEFLAECAVWQIGVIKSAQELDGQLEQLRSRRNAK